jgi:hypothetical protein
MSEETESLDISNSRAWPDQKWWLPYVTTATATLVIIAILLVIDMWGHKFENNAILIAVLPVLIWLLVAGKITSFKAFGVELKSAINELSKENIYVDSGPTASSKIEYDVIEAGPKVDTSQIQSYIKGRIPALYFQIGRKNYYQATAIATWLSHDFFKWVIFVDENDRFKGLVPSDTFRAVGKLGYEPVKQRIENRDVFDLPGFVGQEWALTTASTKGEAIEKFSNLEAHDLPVVDAANFKFKGVLNRAKLNSTLLAAIFRVSRADL